MKHSKTSTLLALTGSSILAISHASAALVSVDLNRSGAQSTVTISTIGIWTEGSNTWNTVGSSLTSTAALRDSSNNLTTINFALTNTIIGQDATNGQANDWIGGTNDALVSDGFYRRQDTGATIMTTTISGLQLNTNYELLVYHADDNVTEAATVNNIAGSDFTGSVGATGYVDAFDTLTGSDFWYFSSINSGGSGVLTIRSAGTGTSGTYNTISGFQLQAIPEPSAALLGGLGMLALLRRRR